MEPGTIVACISGPREAMLSLPRRRGVDLFEHTDREGPGELFSVQAYVSPGAVEELRAEGFTVQVATSAGDLRAKIDRARSQTYQARPVALIVVRGSGDLLSDLPGRFGVDPPVYTARALDEGGWEISTEADEETIAAFRGGGLAVEIVEPPDVLARRRGER